MNPLSSVGSVDISLQLDNREGCTATQFCRGWVSQPFARTSETISVGRFSKIDVSVSRYESRPTIYN